MDAASLHLVCGFWFLKDGTGCVVLCFYSNICDDPSQGTSNSMLDFK
jgi:hypothetical protein